MYIFVCVLKILRDCMIYYLKYMFSVFKKYYTLFSHTFSLTHISKKTKNCVFKKTENSYLNTHTKWALNILKKKKKKKGISEYKFRYFQKQSH